MDVRFFSVVKVTRGHFSIFDCSFFPVINWVFSIQLSCQGSRGENEMDFLLPIKKLIIVFNWVSSQGP